MAGKFGVDGVDPDLTQSSWELARGYTITFLASTSLCLYTVCKDASRRGTTLLILETKIAYYQLYRADPFGSTGQVDQRCCSSEALPDDGRIIARSQLSYNNLVGVNDVLRKALSASDMHPGVGPTLASVSRNTSRVIEAIALYRALSNEADSSRGISAPWVTSC